MTFPDYISPATDADVTALTQLVNGAYRGESSKKGWTTEADLLDGQRTDEASVRLMLQHPNVMLLKYERQHQLIGCVYLEVKGRALYVGMLTVSPEAQTNGIGKQLMAAAEHVATAKQCRTLTMTVLTVRHELIAWYERRGFHVTGETQPFPNDPRFGIPKQTLSFVVMEKQLLAKNVPLPVDSSQSSM